MEPDFILFQETDDDGDQVQHIWMRATCCVFGFATFDTCWRGKLSIYLQTTSHCWVLFSQVRTGTPPVRYLDNLLQFTSDIHFMKGCENAPADAMSHGINALLLDLCLDYRQFMEEQTKME